MLFICRLASICAITGYMLRHLCAEASKIEKWLLTGDSTRCFCFACRLSAPETRPSRYATTDGPESQITADLTADLGDFLVWHASIVFVFTTLYMVKTRSMA